MSQAELTPDIPGYRIIRKLGAGGMASVWLAEQTKFERQVALKVMSPALGGDPSFRERFLREAKIVARLSHPHIVAVHDVGEHEGHVYMAMEYHTGGDLKARIRKGVTPLEATRVVCEIARALALAHERGVIHRDIKPDNILFRGDGSAVLTDFGIAKQGDTNTQFTQTGMVVGTPKYMSPEQARGHPLQPESDLYALGVVFYEALTGSAPFQAEDSIALAIKHIKDPPPALPASLKRLQPFVSRLLAKTPADRFHSGAEVAEALEQVTASGALKGLPAAPGAGAAGEPATRHSAPAAVSRGLPVNVDRQD
ncbi:MAG: serine/threonine protein kinase, partial [Burkholderiaceae bacterium]|nr:serine/threonine protein kinase [Burkholderiaceae bacterium]